MHYQRTALRAVSEALADRTVYANAVVVEAFENGDGSAAGGFGRAVLHAAFDDDVEQVNVVCTQAVARDGAFGQVQYGFAEVRGQLVLRLCARELA